LSEHTYRTRPPILDVAVGLVAGSEGALLVDTGTTLTEAAAAIPKSIPRIVGSHELNWAKAIRGEAQASSPIEYAAQLTETMLLGLVALRTGPGKKILYDGERGQITNIADANQYLTREYRAGWAI